MSKDCVFCKIIQGKSPCHKVWEDEDHLAFLSIFPNTEGFTVVVTKEHYSGYVFGLPDHVLVNLVLASKKVGLLLDSKLEDVGMTGLIFEGFGVNHVHTKLFPMHGTKMEKWKPIKSNVNKYFEKYEGYIASHDSEKADDAKLHRLAKKIRGDIVDTEGLPASRRSKF